MGVTKVAIVIYQFRVRLVKKRTERGVLSGSKPRVREREKYVTEKKKKNFLFRKVRQVKLLSS